MDEHIFQWHDQAISGMGRLAHDPRAAELQRWRLEDLQDSGWAVRDLDGTRPSEFRGWDHPYQLVDGSDRVIYCAEPYGLGGGSIAKLARLRDLGWNVFVSAEHAIHYPGRTVAVYVFEDGVERPRFRYYTADAPATPKGAP